MTVFVYLYVWICGLMLYKLKQNIVQMFQLSGNGLNGHNAAAGKKLIEQYNKSRLNGQRHSLCLAPFTNMYFGHRGRVSACCYNRHHLLGTYPEQSLLSIWRGEKAAELRSKLAKNDLSSGCGSCESLIKSKNFDAVIARNYDLLPINLNYPSKLEFELSNTCNLECTMCFGEFSSYIRKNREKKPAIESPYDDNFLKQLYDFIPHLHSTRFFGGEPFLIDLYYKIWDKIIDLNPSCQIVVQTNGTVLNNRVKGFLSNGNFNINVSIDSIDKTTYESIRVNAKFEKVMENIRYFYKYCKENGRNLGISICPMPSNWKEIPEMIKFCNRLDAFMYFNTVWYPEEHSLAHLPSSRLSEILSYFDAFEFFLDALYF